MLNITDAYQLSLSLVTIYTRFNTCTPDSMSFAHFIFAEYVLTQLFNRENEIT